QCHDYVVVSVSVLFSYVFFFFFFSSRRRHTRSKRDWSSDVCSSDLFPCIHGAASTHIDSLAHTFFRGKMWNGYDTSALVTKERRSEERRVGKECRSRGPPKHQKKKEEQLRSLIMIE